MKEILQHGIFKTYYIAQCPTCQCLFRFEKTDIEETADYNKSNIIIICPECNMTITKTLPYITSSTNPLAPKKSMEDYKKEVLGGVNYE